MNEFSYFIHDGSRYVTRHFAPYHLIHPFLKEARDVTEIELRESGKDHAIYAVSLIGASGNTEIDFYVPAITLDDREFIKRTNLQYIDSPDCTIYALHKRS